jgi:hypothetical protein
VHNDSRVSAWCGAESDSSLAVSARNIEPWVALGSSQPHERGSPIHLEDLAGIRHDLSRLGIHIPSNSRRCAGDAAVPYGWSAVYGSRPGTLCLDALHGSSIAKLAGMEGGHALRLLDVLDRLRQLVLG